MTGPQPHTARPHGTPAGHAEADNGVNMRPGPITALFLQSTDDHGEPDNVFRVNTMLPAEEAPSGLGGSLELGRFSPGIGVVG